ncbi:phosphodiesterase [Sinorhizobium sp. 7-81]|uniref:phosphodiesterase n=1 Tax=Sinorhizobium sp. 8-89 TaxID=3049089 RepID=UPI0024C3DE46|nr:phosphodiesterase [Sinorhizobium sp. 8-89]MDK1494255.1 phosphodiesterase [Sinorhizobium sp. 8-89]
MLKIIHVSDTHVAPFGQAVVGLNPCARLSSVVSSINRHHSDAAVCVITGDLTDRGEVAAYETLAEILSESRVPCRLLLGNHDNRPNFRRVFPNEPVDRFGFVQSAMDLDDVRLIFLDTLDDDHPGWGRMCAERIQWLEEVFKDKAASRSLIFMHHPPFSVGVPIFDDIMLNEPHPFLSTIKAEKSILHIAFGHLHLTTSGIWHGIPFSCNRGVSHRIALSFKPGVTEFMESEPTYDIITVTEAGVLVHHTSPVTDGDIIAREYPTDDGMGRLEFTRP